MLSNSLEQQALDRVARMYSSFDSRGRRQPPQRADSRPESHEHHEAPDDCESRGQRGSQENRELPQDPERRAEHDHAEKPAGLLDVLLRDKEQSLIMLLLVILMKDGADLNLILALLYLLI